MLKIRYYRHHQAAVKALAWCPWQPNVLASGGGTADRCIRLWNGSNGTLLNTIDTKSQVCSLLWASQYKELVSAHGLVNLTYNPNEPIHPANVTFSLQVLSK